MEITPVVDFDFASWYVCAAANATSVKLDLAFNASQLAELRQINWDILTFPIPFNFKVKGL